MMTKEKYKQISRKTRFTYGIIYSFITLTLVFFVVVLYWSFTGTDALTLNGPMAARVAKINDRDVVLLELSLCKHTSADGRVVRRFVSDSTEVFSPTMEDEGLAKGCYTYSGERAIPVPIPPQTANGKYRVNFRVTYQTNPLHTITEELVSEEFEIKR